MSDKLNYNKEHASSFFIHLIQNIEQFRSALVEKFPSLGTHVDSLAINPMCSCRRKIQIFIKKNLDSCALLLENFIVNHPEHFSNVQSLIYEGSYKDVTGEKHTIENNQEQLAAFYEKIVNENFSFNSMHLCVDPFTGRLNIYFL